MTDAIDTLRAEKDRLTTCLEKANASAEHFEREWYLRGDEIDTLRAQLAEAQKQCKLLLASLEDLVCYDSHEVEYDGRVFEICPSCGKQDHDDHRPSCEFLTARAAIDAAKGENHE